MRKMKNVVTSGAFFLCLGGWVYSGQVSGQVEGTQAREAVLNAAAAEAAAPGATDAAATPADAVPETTAGPALAQAAEPGPAPGVTVPPATTQKSTDLTAPEIKVDVAGNVTQVNMSGMDINTALHFLSLQTKRNIIASKNVSGTVTVNLYDVTFAQALEAILRPNGFDYIEKGNFIYVYTDKEIDEIRKRDRKTVNRIFNLKYMNAQDASVLVKPMLSSAGAMALTPPGINGLPTGATDTGGENYATDALLVINDYPENLDEVTAALKKMDVRPKQVLVEATVLNATLSDNNALGVDLVSLSGLNFSDIGSVISPISGSATTDTGTGSTSATNVTTPGQLGGTLIPGNSNKQLDIGTNFAKDVPTGGLSIGFLSNHISVFLRALETVTDTTVVANPKILALNKHHGEVHIGAKLGYLTTTTSQTTTQQTVQFLDVGTKLVFRPFIAEDGYIRMEIHPEDSAGTIDSRGVPQTQTTEVTSNVMIKDGRTIVIGGLFRESTSASKGQVPILGNIPVLGVPFRSTNDKTQRSETIVLITPHVINDDTSLYEESMKESADATRMMLGSRAGLQPWGRDRIAKLWYAKAQEEMEKGDKEKALMYVDWALNTNSRFIEAIRLREQITNRKMDEAIDSSIADLVKNTLRGDAATTPDKGGSGVYPPAAPAAPAAAPK
ncbi:MAG TPA: secretin and TonB N-terminal domain-containing protein [Tepidisphaeraceae bacterium]|nr:secretin and TonB N-terminal domain-containing protein [Tepidisphaeraceae bacterium]